MTGVCRTHGPMRRRDDCMWWVCVGFDGEGCDARVTDEDIGRGTVIPNTEVRL